MIYIVIYLSENKYVYDFSLDNNIPWVYDPNIILHKNSHIADDVASRFLSFNLLKFIILP